MPTSPPGPDYLSSSRHQTELRALSPPHLFSLLSVPASRRRRDYLAPVLVEGPWNPSDYAIHLTRRPRGLPMWFSLAAHGTRAYSSAIEGTLAVAREFADDIRRRPHLQLLAEPTLSIVVFRRSGWRADDYDHWSERLRRDATAFVTPSTWRDEPCARVAIVNPRTTRADLARILGSMA